uniref:Transferase CAF17 homolog, mitochondrial n=1 Tax=Cacopsylla melanoneura TaxID=428564 RepID=A0A8D9F1U3_9HEMI
MFRSIIRKVCFQENIFRALHWHRGSDQVFLGLKRSFSERVSHKCILNSSRYCSTSSSAYEVKYENLSNRGLVRLSGEGVDQFLQGVMTNDINHLQNSTSLYTMFLNTKGRILYDSIIYKYNNILLVECDINDIDNFIKHLKMYRVRRKIDIDNMTDVLNAGVIFYPNQNPSKNCDLNGSIKDLEQLVPCSTIYEHDSSFELYVKDLLVAKNNIFIYRDPRLSSLGVRLIHPKDLDINSILEKQNIVQNSDVDNYTTVRYKLGVAEGIEEIPIGNCFPHEYNCDYLHGVSFHKGCYIGQELTARTQHTGEFIIFLETSTHFADTTVS